MKILFVCHRLPYPPNRGGKIRPFNMIRHLSRQHSVTVASLAHTEQEAADAAKLKDYCEEVIAEIVPDSVRWLQAVKALLTSTPSSVAYFWSDRLGRRITDKLHSTKFDLIFVHCAFVAQYVFDWQQGIRVLDFGDLDSAKWAEYARTRAFPLSIGYAIEARKLRRYETMMARRFQRCTVTTRGEMEEYQKLGADIPCTLMPNGVDTTFFRPIDKAENKHSVIVFLGRMDYFPNIDAVRFFVRRIFPIIRRERPDTQFRIIGSNPTGGVRELAKVEGVSVTGYVPDVRPYLADATVSVAPLRIARGTQNKILESMAMGLPVVTTKQAAKGIEAVPGKHLLVADDAENFAWRVLDILEAKNLHSELTKAGRQQVEAAHVWPTSMKILDKVLAEASASEESPRRPSLAHNQALAKCCR